MVLINNQYDSGCVSRSARGFTFAEVMVTLGIVVLFLASAFLVHSRVLQNLRAQKETVAATQTLQERMEQIRSASFSNVADASYLQNNIFNADAQSIVGIPGAVEEVTVSTYPSDGSTPTDMTRQNGALTVNTTNSNLSNGDLIRVDLQLTWITFGSRNRLRRTSTIIGKGNLGP